MDKYYLKDLYFSRDILMINGKEVARVKNLYEDYNLYDEAELTLILRDGTELTVDPYHEVEFLQTIYGWGRNDQRTFSLTYETEPLPPKSPLPLSEGDFMQIHLLSKNYYNPEKSFLVKDILKPLDFDVAAYVVND